MDISKNAHLENVRSVHSELTKLLEGMDYCLDWKLEPESWSARQVVYHVLDTPFGGLPGVIQGILSGELSEIELWSDQDNMTADRSGLDLEQIVKDIDEYFQHMEQALSMVTEQDFTAKSALTHFMSRDIHEQRTVEELLERAFDSHWREHLKQISELRDELAM